MVQNEDKPDFQAFPDRTDTGFLAAGWHAEIVQDGRPRAQPLGRKVYCDQVHQYYTNSSKKLDRLSKA